jgi:hypothetical protein
MDAKEAAKLAGVSTAELNARAAKPAMVNTMAINKPDVIVDTAAVERRITAEQPAAAPVKKSTLAELQELAGNMGEAAKNKLLDARDRMSKPFQDMIDAKRAEMAAGAPKGPDGKPLSGCEALNQRETVPVGASKAVEACLGK